MKTIMTLLFFILSSHSLFGQNPIIREELFENYNNQWEKVSIVDRAYDNQGNLVNEQQLYYENGVSKWVPFLENWYDAAGNNIQTTRKFLQSRELGFYVDNIKRQFNKEGDIVIEEFYVKENKESKNVLNRKVESEYLENCTYLQRIYQLNNEQQLDLSALILVAHDKNCEYAQAVTTNNVEIDIAALKNRVRITFEPTRTGGERRLVEELTCPNIPDCDTWAIRSKNVYDEQGRLIIEESGSADDFFRRITSISYEATQTIHNIDSYVKLNNLTNQSLSGREIYTYNLDGNFLSTVRIEALSSIETYFDYNEQGLVNRSTFTSTIKDSTGVQIFRDTTNYIYQYYCDDLLAEQITDYGNDFKSKTTYSYLYPTNCGQTIEITDFLLFPNPVNSLLNIENEAFVNGNYTLDIFDMLGRHIRNVSNYRSNVVAINVADLPNGLYQLSIKNGDGRITQPFTVQR